MCDWFLGNLHVHADILEAQFLLSVLWVPGNTMDGAGCLLNRKYIGLFIKDSSGKGISVHVELKLYLCECISKIYS